MEETNIDNNDVAKKKKSRVFDDQRAMPPPNPPLMSSTYANVQLHSANYYQNNTLVEANSFKDVTADAYVRKDPPSLPENNQILEASGAPSVNDRSSLAEETGHPFKVGRKVISEQAKLKRNLANRVAARRSRMKKLQHIANMEAKIKALQAETEDLCLQISNFQRQSRHLEMENNMLNHEISVRTSNFRQQQAEIAANKAEVERLRQIHEIQQGYTLHSYAIPNLNQATLQHFE